MAPSKSRLTLARAAIRPSMYGKVMLSGPSGAGKTFTALVIAETLAPPDGRILLIDTEKESALTYADVFKFEHLRWSPPFDPRELQDTLLAAGSEYDVIITDSFSHFWRGSGGVLDIANGRFTGWKDARPAQVDVVDAALETDAHVILCCRSSMGHEQQTGSNGRIEVVKLGMQAQQDGDLEYEVNVSIEVDMQHVLQISKSRTNAIPVGRSFPAGHAPEFASLYRDWLKGGEPVATKEQTENLVAVLNRIEQEAERVKAKQAFLEVFGRPEFLLVSRVPEASEWVADQVLAANGGAVTGAATEGADAPAAEAEPGAGKLSGTDAPPDGTTPAQGHTAPANGAGATPTRQKRSAKANGTPDPALAVDPSE